MLVTNLHFRYHGNVENIQTKLQTILCSNFYKEGYHYTNTLVVFIRLLRLNPFKTDTCRLPSEILSMNVAS